MTDLPQAAIDAASTADRDWAFAAAGTRIWISIEDNRLRHILAAASPLIAAAERERIATQLETIGRGDVPCPRYHLDPYRNAAHIVRGAP